MTIATRTVGEVSILDCSGKITVGDGAAAVRNAVQQVLKNGGRKIVLNLGEVSYIDSAGIGELVSSYTSVTNKGGKLFLLNLNEKIQFVLAITKLINVFRVFQDENKAVSEAAADC